MGEPAELLEDVAASIDNSMAYLEGFPHFLIFGTKQTPQFPVFWQTIYFGGCANQNNGDSCCTMCLTTIPLGRSLFGQFPVCFFACSHGDQIVYNSESHRKRLGRKICELKVLFIGLLHLVQIQGLPPQKKTDRFHPPF